MKAENNSKQIIGSIYFLLTFKRQPHKMVKHTQIADELFECVWPFCGVGA